MANPHKTILQISDTHLFADTSSDLLGLNTHSSFNAVIKLAKTSQRHIDIILLTGDLAQDLSKQAYKRLAQELEVFTCPIYWIPGNHDDPNVMQSIFKSTVLKPDKQIIFDDWQLILLSSHKPGAVEGFISEQQFKFLHKCIEQYPDHFVLVALHHPPFKVGSAWLDQSRLKNADKLIENLSKYSNIKLVICGHVHQENQANINDVLYLSSPSTCIQFMPKSENFELDTKAPGCRWISLFNNGSIETEIERVADFVVKTDSDAAGY